MADIKSLPPREKAFSKLEFMKGNYPCTCGKREEDMCGLGVEPGPCELCDAYEDYRRECEKQSHEGNHG